MLKLEQGEQGSRVLQLWTATQSPLLSNFPAFVHIVQCLEFF